MDTDTRSLLFREPAPSIWPILCHFHEVVVTLIVNELQDPDALAIVRSAHLEPGVDDVTISEMGAVRTGLKPFLFEAAELDLALGSLDIPFTAGITELASLAQSLVQLLAGLAISTAASDVLNAHCTSPGG